MLQYKHFDLLEKDIRESKKVASILNIHKPINAHSWRGHTEVISECSEKIMYVNSSFDGSWNTQGWSSKTGIVDARFEPTGKVLDVITKFSQCKNCQEKKVKMMHVK